MCGIACFIAKDNLEKECHANAIRYMTDQMHRRGPDDVGYWQSGGVYLGHRRLSILDLDTRASQPMKSNCGRYVIVYNGEVYNFREIRQYLETQGEHFKTSCDTEVILAIYAHEGVAALKRLKGMFSFFIWDIVNKKGFAARDPYGIKPLYYAATSNGLLLGSQVKAMMASGLVDDTPDEMGQFGFWMLGSVPEPYTWYKGIRSLQAGHYLMIENGEIKKCEKWHDISDVWRSCSLENTIDTTDSEFKAHVKSSVAESVDRHMVSDVPLAVFLSGGIDSGALAGLMKERTTSPLTAVTIVFDEYSGNSTDEYPVASLIARHYGIRHHVRKVTRDEFVSDLPRIMNAMDQPSIDGINTWYASKAVAELGLKVVVSGLGGDELFMGYNSFKTLPRIVNSWKSISRVPGVFGLSKWLSSLHALRTRNMRWKHAPDWLLSIGGAWWLTRSSTSPETAVSLIQGNFSLLSQDFNPQDWISWMVGPLSEDMHLALSQIESSTYMRNQLLRDSDWSSMDHSVELRTPLVDSHLLSTLKPFLPFMHRLSGKQSLASSPSNPLPIAVVKRPKTGFSIPIKSWISEEFGQNHSLQRIFAESARYYFR